MTKPRRPHALLTGLLAAVSLSGFVPVPNDSSLATLAAAQSTAPAAPGAAHAREVIGRYCVTCHSKRVQAGGLTLDDLDVAKVPAHSEVWEKVVRKLRAGAMPPKGSPRPDAATYRAVVSELEASLDLTAKVTPNPGRPLIHRLNRLEYRNAVRDLLGLELDEKALLPPDSSSHGFDNIADVLTFSPGLMERYLLVAQQISAMAVGGGRLKAAKYTYEFPLVYVQEHRPSEGLPMGSRGVAIRHAFPADGEYEIRIRLQKKRGGSGSLRGMDEQHDVDVRLDGQRVKVFAIGGKSPGTEMSASFAYRDALEKRMVVRLPVKAGTHELGILFRQQYRAMEGVGPSRLPALSGSFSEGLNTSPQYGKVEAGVDAVDIEGPFDLPSAEENPQRRRLLACPARLSRDERGCAASVLSALARRAYRRPVVDADTRVLMKFFDEGLAAGDFAAGIQRALDVILTHPEFLVRMERDPQGIKPGAVYAITDVELASRLSFFLWSSIPDDELLDLAARGRLRKPGVLEAQVERMLRDTRSEAFLTNFFGQWLAVRNLEMMVPDPKIYPEFDGNLREAFQTETALFLRAQLGENRSALELLTANYTFVNERLARFYGIPNVYGGHFRRVALPGDHRAGILGHASLLTVTSYANRTSPVGRGKWLLANILGIPPPPPPPNVPPFPESEGPQPASVRARMEQHRKNPACASCHATIDPLGFALENFDAIGAWRTTDAKSSIDASGMLPDGTPFARPSEFRQALVSRYGELFTTTLVERLLMYAIGREVQHDDMPMVRAITTKAARNDYRWRSLILEVVMSPPFQMRKAA